MWWSLVKASQFAREAFSCLYMGLIVVRINIRNEKIMKCNTNQPWECLNINGKIIILKVSKKQ